MGGLQRIIEVLFITTHSGGIEYSVGVEELLESSVEKINIATRNLN